MEGPRHLSRVTYSVKGTNQCRLPAVDREMPQTHGAICTSITPVRQKEDFSGLKVSDWVGVGSEVVVGYAAKPL
jgi:hypothetical protein